MSDLDKFLEILHNAGYKEGDSSSTKDKIYSKHVEYNLEIKNIAGEFKEVTSIIFGEGDGYFGFSCGFYFNSETGRLIYHGAWE